MLARVGRGAGRESATSNDGRSVALQLGGTVKWRARTFDSCRIIGRSGKRAMFSEKVDMFQPGLEFPR